MQSRTGKVLVAIRDSEQRVLFSAYTPSTFKLFVFVSKGVFATLRSKPTEECGRILQDPSLLLVDEPVARMTDKETEQTGGSLAASRHDT